MLTPLQILLMSIGTILLVLWIVLFVRGRKFVDLFAGITEKEFPLRDLYHLGYAGLELVGYSFRSARDVRLRTLMEVIFTRHYAEFYLRTIRAQQVSIGLTIAVAAFGIYGVTGSIEMLVMLLIVSALAVFYSVDRVKTLVRRRNDELLRDFCDVVSMLALLTNASMILREAWHQASLAGDSVIYQEMRRSVERIDNGVSDSEAIMEFGTRAMLPEVKKFTSLLTQAMHRGGAELPAMLTAQSTEAWHLKKQIVQRQSNKAGAKLLMPMMLMFAGILILVIVPMFVGMGV